MIMENIILGILCMLIGVIVYISKENIIKYRMRIYLSLNKKISQEEIVLTENIFRFTLIAVILIAFITEIGFIIEEI